MNSAAIPVLPPGRGLRSNRFRRLLRLGLLVACVEISVAFLAMGLFAGFLSEKGKGAADRDFAVFYAASSAGLEGASEAANLYDPDHLRLRLEALLDKPVQGMLWLYSPIGLLWVLPLSLLPVTVAYILWTAINVLGCLLASWALGLRRRGILLLALFPTLIINILAGQNGGITTGLFGLGIALLSRYPWLAGSAFGALCYKPQFGLLIPIVLLAGGYWRAALGAAGTCALLLLASLAVFGTEPWQAFLRWSPRTWEILMSGEPVWWKMVTSYAFLRQLGAGHGLALFGQAITAAIAAAATWRIYRYSGDLSARTAILVYGTLLATPYAYVYDLTLLLLPFAALLSQRRLRDTNALEAGLLGALWLAPALHWLAAQATQFQFWLPLLAASIAISVLFRPKDQTA